MDVYAIKCHVCGKQFNGTLTKFHATVKNHKITITIFENKKKNFQTKSITRNVFTNTIFRVSIMEFATGR